MAKNAEKLKKPLIFLGLFLVFAIGVYLRFHMLFKRALWADEVFYLTIAKTKSIFDIILAKHWIKDNPPLFFLFVKTWSFVSNKIFWLRLPGIISFVFSFFLLARLLRKLDRLSLVFILLLFSISTYFVHVNYWLSPYNFTIALSLIELNLIHDFFKGKIKGVSFILLFSFFNFLLINIHYSSLYFFLSYPFFLIYFFFFKRREVFETFLFALLTSFILFLPTLHLIFVNKTRIYEFQQQDLGGVWFLSLKDAFLYFLDRSFLRIRNLIMTTKVVFLIFAAFVLSVISKVKVNKFHFLSFLFLFLPALIFLFAFHKKAPAIMGERPLWVLHIASYLGLALLLSALKRVNWVLHLLFAFLLIFITTAAFLREKGSDNRYSGAGQVSLDQFLQEDYDRFILDLAEETKKGERTIVYYGDDMKDAHQDYIFFNYYLQYDERLKEVKEKEFLLAKETTEIEENINKDEKLLIVNFYRRRSVERFFLEKLIVGKYNVKVIDYWPYVDNF
jgi:hypothetical protein